MPAHDLSIQQISDAAIEVVKQTAGIDNVKISDHLIDDLDLDSLEVVQLVMAFEDHFDIEVPDSDAEKLSTVQDIIVYVAKQCGSSA